MGGPYIQRIPHRAQPRGYGGCIAAALIVVTVIIVGLAVLLPSLPGMLAGALGFRPIGATGQVYLQPVNPPRIQLGAVSGTISVNAGALGTIPLENAQSATVDGRAATVVRVSETQLNVLCRTRTPICAASPAPPVYDATIDLRSGGALVRGMVYVGPLGIYQQAALALRFAGSSVTIAGVDIDGTLYSLPDSGLGTSVLDLQRRMDEVLRGITATDGSRVLALSGMYADDAMLTLVFR
jgi:hypothetical protein